VPVAEMCVLLESAKSEITQRYYATADRLRMFVIASVIVRRIITITRYHTSLTCVEVIWIKQSV